MKFKNREDAAQQLSDRLAGYKNSNALVLAIPRGAVPMGRKLADALAAELDVVLVRKLRAPRNPEFAIGSVDESGWVYLSSYAAGVDPYYVEQEISFQREVLRKRRALYTPSRSAINPRGRIAIVLDDGLATGATMIAALHSLSGKQPKKIISAVPVASNRNLALVRPYADEVLCLHAPENFGAVNQFYEEFPQVENEEVVACLKTAC